MLTDPTAGTSVRPAPASALDQVIFFGVFALLFFGPLAFGAVEPWSIFVLESGSALLLLLWTIRQATSGELTLQSNALFAPMLAFALCIALQVASGRTVYRHETIAAGLLYCAYGVLCFLVIQLLRRTSQLRTVTVMFTVYGFALASFALLQGLSSTSKLYWLRTPRLGGWIYGPYVNHNHYAGLMEMLVPIPLIFVLTRGARGPRKAAAAITAVLMTTTIFLSGSRGGMLAFMVQVAVLIAIVTGQRRGYRVALTLGIFLVAGVGVLAWVGGAELSQRLASIRTDTRTELSGGTRLLIDRDALRMFSRRPLSGWGLGTFPDVYPQFRSFPTNFFVNDAHNDYLQLLVETGVPGFVIMLWFLWRLFRNGARKLQNWAEDVNGAAALAAMLGVTGILVHSFLDFNLQVPANAALFYVLCVVAAMEPRLGSSRRRRVRHVDVMAEIPEGTQPGEVAASA